jgi:hypothetical protein
MMITMWFLALTINGLAFSTIEPFNSEEACILAAKTVGAAKDQFTCVSREFPAPHDQSN